MRMRMVWTCSFGSRGVVVGEEWTGVGTVV